MGLGLEEGQDTGGSCCLALTLMLTCLVITTRSSGTLVG